MGNKYYDAGETRAARVNDLFDTIAPRYDLINDLQSFWMHRVWKRRLLGIAAPRVGEQALDLCCGTGDIAFGLARQGAVVTGLDFSASMLAVARQRAGQIQGSRGNAGDAAGRPAFIQGDAMELPFADGQFDIVTIGYGLRNLADWKLGLREMLRVAKPGGRLLVLDFGKPDNATWRGLYFAYLRLIVPIFGKLFCGDSQTHSYILESLRHYPAQRGVADEMRSLGCSDVRIVNLLGGVMSINFGVK